MKYRAEIDGLRAIAVVPVIFFHAGFDLFSGGFVGVDIFFVVSGYLITTIIIEDIENKRFSILYFYERRARRILPALYLVMAFSVFVAWILLSDVALNKFGNGLLGVTFFISNIIFWQQEEGYFDEAAELNPLLHTWSLSVEEQYYLLFPIFLILAWRFGKQKVFWMIVALLIFSLLLSEWGWRNRATANFYLAPTRAWELLVGSVGSFIVQRNGVQKNNTLALLGLAAIIFSIFAYDQSTPFPSIYGSVPVLGVVLIILFANNDTIVCKLLSKRAFVGVGLISYSAYLWHQPLFAFTRIYTNKLHLSLELSLALIFATLVIAFLSWKFIEIPFRSKAQVSRRLLFVAISAAFILMVLIGLASKIAVQNAEYRLAKILSKNEYVYFQNMDERKFIEGRLQYPLKKVENIIVGSSRLMQVSSDTIGEPLINLAVSGAAIEDNIAFALEASAKLQASHVYIAGDPWLVNKFSNQDRYISVKHLYEYWLNNAEKSKSLKSYFDINMAIEDENSDEGLLQLIRKVLHPTSRSVAEDGKIGAIAKKAYDGFHVVAETDLEASKNVSQNFDILLNYAMSRFEHDEKAEKELSLLVNYLKKNGLDVSLVLSPYHPDLYFLMKTKKQIFLEIEKRFRQFSKEHNIEIIGSYDPAQIGCDEYEFYDGMHPKPSCMAKVFNGRK